MTMNMDIGLNGGISSGKDWDLPEPNCFHVLCIYRQRYISHIKNYPESMLNTALLEENERKT